MRKPPTVDDLEAFALQLKGPMGGLLRRAGDIMATRMGEQGLGWADLDDAAVTRLFVSAVMQAAPDAYPGADPAVIEEALDRLAAGVAMEAAATTAGTDTIN